MGLTFSWAAHGAPSDITQTTRAPGTRYRTHLVSLRIQPPCTSPSGRTPLKFGGRSVCHYPDPRVTASFIGRSRSLRSFCAVRTVTRQEKATPVPARNPSRTRQNAVLSLRSPSKRARAFARYVRSHAAAVQARSALIHPTRRRQLRRSRGISHGLPHEQVERLSVPSGRHHLCGCVQSARGRADIGDAKDERS